MGTVWPGASQTLGIFLPENVCDERVTRGSPLREKYPSDGGFVEGTRRQAIHGLGRERDETSPAENSRSFVHSASVRRVGVDD
jgi:hypothetical protein